MDCLKVMMWYWEINNVICGDKGVWNNKEGTMMHSVSVAK